MATISGTVKDSTGAFAARLVRAYRRSDGAFAGQVLSNATTGAYSITTLDGTAHFAVAHDGVVGDYDAYWNNVVLAMHMDGENNSTTFQDLTGKTVTPFGNAKIVTTQSMFGGASLRLAGGYDEVVVASDYSWAWGTRDFTVECFVRPDSVASFMNILATGNYGTSQFEFRISDTGKLQCFISEGLNALGILTGSTTLAAATWQHVAVTRQGGIVRMFLDGALQATSGATSISIMPTGLGRIGKRDGSTAVSFSGYIDEMRVSIGVARYTAGFTPPTAPFLGAISIGPSSKNALIFDNVIPT